MERLSVFMHLLLKSLEAGEVLQVASCYSSVGDVTLFFFFFIFTTAQGFCDSQEVSGCALSNSSSLYTAPVRLYAEEL